MQKSLFYFVLYLISVDLISSANATEVMSEDMLLDNNVAVINSDSNGKEVEDSDKTWNFSFWNFITKPLSLFSDEDTQANSESEGKKETYMEKNIRLANEGKLDAQMNLGYMYLYGINGVEVDFDKAFQYYTLAAAQKDPIALNNLGSLYFSGIGTKTNVQKAAELFAEAANNGNDNAAVNLAFIYLVGGAKDKQRNQKAVTLFQQAADLGNNIAKFMLGYAYYKGFAVEQNYQKAYELVKAAAGGNSRIDEAQMVLGEMLIEGNGTVQNFHDGINALRAAVMQGNMEAFLVVAKIYAEGSFVPRNPILAHALYNIAASRNVAGAAKMREDIAKTLTREQLSAAQKQAQNFKDNPSELTLYIRQTFGPNIRDYIHNNM